MANYSRPLWDTPRFFNSWNDTNFIFLLPAGQALQKEWHTFVAELLSRRFQWCLAREMEAGSGRVLTALHGLEIFKNYFMCVRLCTGVVCVCVCVCGPPFTCWCSVHFPLKRTQPPEIKINKTVLLRERKRHTAHRVASARYAVLVRGGTYPGAGGYLPWWGVPTLVGGTYPGGGYLPWWEGGTYPGGRGVPILVGGGYLPWYPIQTWEGRYPPTLPEGRYPPNPDLGR